MLKRAIKRVLPGVSWQNPVINTAYRLIDPVDWSVRATRGLTHLPPYSIRVRSNGVDGQFGGARFDRFGQNIVRLLETHAGLVPSSDVLEIGCGCGRTAYALSSVLEQGSYTGMDIERVALGSALKNEAFAARGFRFDYQDVYNLEYNPEGRQPASSYTFPYEDGSFDVIFLISVFTHMLTEDVERYVAEIARLLRPGGHCLMTTFLVDKGTMTGGLSFPFQAQEHYFYDREMPEVAIGYESRFFTEQFERHGMELAGGVQWGSWRNRPDVASHTGFPQDFLAFSKPSL